MPLKERSSVQLSCLSVKGQVYNSHASQGKVKCTTPIALSERSSVQLPCLSVKGQVYNSHASQ
ncbi:hypothetical protein DPMN_092022 [Dreissena polymorpha]|uniref:Uncharacterized protein n=1 Tax=Dreissena polymorpha TaxID=45954 RepID=A0A9D4R0E8_DREPO|nr:hypothetical protein DPMN_091956 [Dreissena polymorpha]KAH3849619.1 hypothetical protein DPMN_092022 [Dreissena polymorpha]